MCFCFVLLLFLSSLLLHTPACAFYSCHSSEGDDGKSESRHPTVGGSWEGGSTVMSVCDLDIRGRWVYCNEGL